MADTGVGVTPGSGADIAVNVVGSLKMQRVKLDIGGDGVSIPLVGTDTYGVKVDVTRIAGNVTIVPAAAQIFPVSDNGGSLTVDGSVTAVAAKTAPVGVRLSDGTNWVDTIPVSGGVTAAQGAPAVAANRWLVQLHDGTTAATVDAGTGGLKVAIVSGGGGGTALADKAAFAEGTDDITPVGGEYNDSPSDPSAGHVAAVRITQKRSLHVNLREAGGTEIGTSGAPIRVDPTGTTPQPVTQSIANWTINQVKLGGDTIAKVGTGIQQVSVVDSSGSAFSPANPLEVQRSGRKNARVTNSVALSASQTASALWTPASGKKFYIDEIVLVVTTAGPLKIFDGTDAAGNRVFDSGSPNWPTGVFTIHFDEPWASSTANNVLNYTSGSGLVGVITVHGHEA